jgi:O-antigen ligase
MKKQYGLIDKIIEHGIYLFIFFLFLAKGEAIRNILVFGSFTLWAVTLNNRGNLSLLKKQLSIFCWVYLGSVVLSVLFSIDPLYSLSELKEKPLKFAILFTVISTVMADEERLKKAAVVCFITGMFMVLAGYYSYIFHDIRMLKPDTVLVHAWHNKFARYLCMMLSYTFILYFVWRRTVLKSLLVIVLIFSFIALILSTSRGGFLGFLGAVLVWSLYIARTKGYNFKKILAYILIVILVTGTFSYLTFPSVHRRINKLPKDIHTLTKRTELWEAAVYAIRVRPVFGWGYGDSLYRRDEPFKDTIYNKAPQTEKGIHNVFLRIMFHQGLAGLISYILIIFTAAKEFWKEAFRTTGISSYMLVACVSVLVSNYILHAMLADVELIHLAVVLGLGMAAKGISENSRA